MYPNTSNAFETKPDRRAAALSLAVRPAKATRGDRLALITDPAATELVAGLRQRGFAVEQCSTVREARARISLEKPALLILELRLPDGPCTRLIELARAINPSCRILVLTAYGSVASAVTCTRLGANAYLLKPASAESVLRAVAGDVSPSCAVPSSPCTLNRAVWEYVNRAVEVGGSISKGADFLGIDRRSLRRMLSKYAPSK